MFGDAKTARMWNFKKLECAIGRKKSSTSFSGDKGHAAEMKALLDGFESGSRFPHQHRLVGGNLPCNVRRHGIRQNELRGAGIVHYSGMQTPTVDTCCR